jgi:hypothetical protein
MLKYLRYADVTYRVMVQVQKTLMDARPMLPSRLKNNTQSPDGIRLFNFTKYLWAVLWIRIFWPGLIRIRKNPS